MTNQVIAIHDLKALPFAAKSLLKTFSAHKVFAFYGEMGAGKTTFIKELCRQLGVKENEMSSPTFALINQYYSFPQFNSKPGVGEPLKVNNTIYHFDFYRIKNENEVFDLGYEEYFYSGNYCFIEWPEKIPNLLPGFCVKIRIEDENTSRKLIINQD